MASGRTRACWPSKKCSIWSDCLKPPSTSIVLYCVIIYNVEQLVERRAEARRSTLKRAPRGQQTNSQRPEAGIGTVRGWIPALASTA